MEAASKLTSKPQKDYGEHIIELFGKWKQDPDDDSIKNKVQVLIDKLLVSELNKLSPSVFHQYESLEDIRQEMRLAAWKAFINIKDTANNKTAYAYLTRTIKCVILESRRRTSRRTVKEQTIQRRKAPQYDEVGTSVSDIIASPELLKVAEMLASGYTRSEIVNSTGLDATTVSRNINKIKKIIGARI